MRRYLLLAVLATIISAPFVSAQEVKDKHKDKEKHYDSDKPRIEGSGNVITKNVAVQSFDELSVSGVFSVNLIQGGSEAVKIEADDNLQALFEVKTEGSNFNSKKGLKVYITFKKLKGMELKTVGNISSESALNFEDLKIENKSVGSIDLKLNAGTLNIDNKSVGNIKLNGKADNVVIRNEGVGSIKAYDFVVQKMDINNSGVGSAEVNAEKELKVKDSFLGKVSNKGAAVAKKKVVI
jgi:hypothetical protein